MKHLLHPLFIICIILKYATAFLLFGDFFAILHDNLDSEIVYSVVKGRYFAGGFDSAVFDVFLGGEFKWYYIDRLFSPLTLLYAALPPWWAYFSTELLGLGLAYAGMLTLLTRLTGPQKYNRLLSVVYAFSLSFSGYGFGLHIAPFVLAYLVRPKAGSVLGYLTIFFLGTLTSLVLHGMFFPFAALVFLWIFRQKTSIRHFALTLGSFGLGSVVASSTVIFAMVQKIVYHRADWPIDDAPFEIGKLLLTTLNNVLTLGPWYHALYIPAIAVLFTVLAGALSNRADIQRITALVVAFIAASSLLSDFSPYYAPYLPSIIASVQFGRLGFFSGLLLLSLASFILAKPSRRSIRGITLTGAWIYLVFALMSGAGISLDNLKTAFTMAQQRQIVAAVKAYGINAAFSTELLGENTLNWSSFQNTRGNFGANFQGDTYSCFSNYITNGRALTFGYDPMVAAYHGIPVIDGYHNLYPRSYKQAFLKVISEQLPVSIQGPDYYNNWGNRVYSFVETPTDIRIDYSAAEALGARYVISRFAVESEDLSEIASECGAQSGFYLYEITTN